MSARPPITFLQELNDVTVASPADEEALIYDAGTSKWNNAPIPPMALASLTDVTVVSPTDAEFLRYQTGAWVNFGPLAFTDVTGNINVSQMDTGAGASSATFWRGDGVWAPAISAAPGTSGNVMTSDGANWYSASIPPGTVASGDIITEPSAGAPALGDLGEYMEGIRLSGSALSISTATPLSMATITLSPGDWSVSGVGAILPAASTSFTRVVAAISAANNTIQSVDLFRMNRMSFGAIVPGISFPYHIPVGPVRVSVSVSTQLWIVVEAAFSVSTATAYGKISARRMR